MINTWYTIARIVKTNMFQLSKKIQKVFDNKVFPLIRKPKFWTT